MPPLILNLSVNKPSFRPPSEVYKWSTTMREARAAHRRKHLLPSPTPPLPEPSSPESSSLESSSPSSSIDTASQLSNLPIVPTFETEWSNKAYAGEATTIAKTPFTYELVNWQRLPGYCTTFKQLLMRWII
jgi:hypothetical protein